MRKVIVNTTPIIALSHIGKLSLLHSIYEHYIIPQAVYQELNAKDDTICEKELKKNQDWFTVKNIQDELAKTFFKSQLHEGEVEVMILAKEIQADLVIIDDANAKKYAKYLGLTVTGTLGVLLRAKEQGHITQIKPLLEMMQKEHIYLSKEIIQYCLKTAGEL